MLAKAGTEARRFGANPYCGLATLVIECAVIGVMAFEVCCIGIHTILLFVQ
jgi:23S rRNA G2445 N2-methylase RlmL